jgi:outer membrane lipoprotein-sorting protein
MDSAAKPFAFLLAALCLLPLAPAQAAPLTPAQALEVVRTIDQRQKSSGDYKALCYLESKEKEKTDVVYELLVYRREAEAKFMLLFTKPRAEQGKGYLRLDKNLWMFDPGTGKWERRTERERIGGTDTRRGDLDESRLAEEYDVTFEREEKLGAFQVWKLNLKVKEGVDVAFPIVALWVDQATGNVLKR